MNREERDSLVKQARLGSIEGCWQLGLWLELLREECGINHALSKPLEREYSELIAIMTTMIRRTDFIPDFPFPLSAFRFSP